MAAIHGKLGKVTISDLLSECNMGTHSWSLDIQADATEVTNFCSSGSREYIAGLKQWSGSLELYVDGTNRLSSTNVGVIAPIHLYDSATHYYTGNALLTQISPAVSVDGVVTQTVNFQGTGEISESA